MARSARRGSMRQPSMDQTSRPRRRKIQSNEPWRRRAPSCSSSHRFRGRPPPKPVSPPSEPMTRWQGTTIGSGFWPFAAPTARVAFPSPTHCASSRYVRVVPTGMRRRLLHTRVWKVVPWKWTGNSARASSSPSKNLRRAVHAPPGFFVGTSSTSPRTRWAQSRSGLSPLKVTAIKMPASAASPSGPIGESNSAVSIWTILQRTDEPASRIRHGRVVPDDPRTRVQWVAGTS